MRTAALPAVLILGYLALGPQSVAEELALTHGVVIQTPTGWRVAADWERKRSRQAHVYANPELANQIHQADAEGTTETLIILAKHSSNHVGLNPSIQINRTPLPEKLKHIGADKLLEAMLPLLTHTFHDVKVEEWMPSVKVGGQVGAQFTVTYASHAKSGRVIPSRAIFVLTISGNHFVVIGMSSPSDGSDDTRPEFKKFLSGIRFEKPAA